MTATAVRPASRWEDFVEIFMAPARVFARRAESNPLLPMAVIAVLSAVLYYLTMPLLQSVWDAELAKGMEAAARQNPQLTPDQIAKGTQFQLMITGVSMLVIVPVVLCLIALTMWLLGRVVASKQTFRAALVVASFAYFPRVIEWIVYALEGALLPESQLTSRASISLGLARFLGADASPLLTAFALRIDVFTIWVTVLIAIGLRITGKISGAQAAGIAVLVWLLGAVPSLLGALRS